jgi:hypothetical protein
MEEQIFELIYNIYIGPLRLKESHKEMAKEITSHVMEFTKFCISDVILTGDSNSCYDVDGNAYDDIGNPLYPTMDSVYNFWFTNVHKNR